MQNSLYISTADVFVKFKTQMCAHTAHEKCVCVTELTNSVSKTIHVTNRKQNRLADGIHADCSELQIIMIHAKMTECC